MQIFPFNLLQSVYFGVIQFNYIYHSTDIKQLNFQSKHFSQIPDAIANSITSTPLAKFPIENSIVCCL